MKEITADRLVRESNGFIVGKLRTRTSF